MTKGKLETFDAEFYSNSFSYYKSKVTITRYVFHMENDFDFQYNTKSNMNQIYFELFREFM